MRKKVFYAVARGRKKGVYFSWPECSKQVNKYPGALFKKFPTKREAEDFIKFHGSEVTKVQLGIGAAPLPSETSSEFPDAIPSSSHSVATSGNVEKSCLESGEVGVIDKVTKQENVGLDMDLDSFIVDEQGYVVVFTDGACKNNGKDDAKAGIGVWFGNEHALNISERVQGRQTNITADIQAAERAILQAKQLGINKLCINTDSQFTIDCVKKWMSNWKISNWKSSTGQVIKNKEDLEKLDKAMDMMDVKWCFIAGRKGIYGNEDANRLAVLGMGNGKATCT